MCRAIYPLWGGLYHCMHHHCSADPLATRKEIRCAPLPILSLAGFALRYAE